MSAHALDPHVVMNALSQAIADGYMLAVFHPSGSIAYVNDHLARALGVLPQALIGEPVQSILAEDDSLFDLPTVLSYLCHCRLWNGKFMLARADGSAFTVKGSVLRLQIAASPVNYVALTAVSAARRLDFPISSDNAQDSFFSMLEGLGSAIILHREGQIVYANEPALRLCGYTRKQLQHTAYETLAHPDHRARVHEHVQARLRGEATRTRFESCLVTPDGTVRWVEQTLGLLQIDHKPTVLDTYVDLTDRRQATLAQAQMQQVLAQIIDGSPVPTVVLNAQHTVTHWNHACEVISGVPAQRVVGTQKQWETFYPEPRPILADLIISGALDAEVRQHYQHKYQSSSLIADAYEAVDFFPQFGASGRWLHFTAAPLRDSEGRITGAIETLVDVTERRQAEEDLRIAQAGLEQLVEQRTAQLASANIQLAQDISKREQAELALTQRNDELEHLNAQLSQAQAQLLQSEKLASIGQLAAGVAHEINNPIGYVHSNIGSLQTYLTDLFKLLEAYEQLPTTPAVQALRQQINLDFLLEDVPSLIRESQEGISRVKKIVQDLKDFSRVDSTREWQSADLHQGIDSTLNIVNNEIKYHADVIKEYGTLPLVHCLPSQLNQVFMNLLVNAAHAMGSKRGTITVRTGTLDAEHVWLEFADNGSGISKENLSKVFDPFFTTKPVGKGTGLGLSLTYGIIQKHHGVIRVTSELGQGTVFRLELPVHQTVEPPSGESEHV